MSEYESSSLVVIDQMQPLADSRVIARELGIDHESFSTMAKRDQQEIEADFGRIRCEIGVKAGPQRGKLPRSALLTEDQTYVYLSYSQNTSQARACKRLLVKAFREARAHLQAVSAPQPRIKSLWERRVETFRLATKIPEGYWCIFEMIASYCRTEEYRGVHLCPQALPNVSIGLLWCQYLRALARLRSAPGEEVSTCVPGPARRPARQHLPQRLVRRMLDVVSWLLPQRALPGLPPRAHDPYDYDHRGGTSSAAYEQERRRGKAA
jgi:hypothetical protein